jgi:hypothetical protein
MKLSIKADPGAGIDLSFLRGLAPESSSEEEKSTENEESQKLQTPALDGSTAPHCKQVLVTG